MTNPNNMDEEKKQKVFGAFQEDENVYFEDRYLYVCMVASTPKSVTFSFKQAPKQVN